MIVQANLHDQIEQTIAAQAPANKNSWRFGELSAAELLPKLQKVLTAQDTNAHWQLVWLNNDGKPIIGLLPKVSWSVYFQPNQQRFDTKAPSAYRVDKTCRDHDNALVTKYMSYGDWQEELINYSRTHENNESALTSTNIEDEKSSYHHGLIGFIGYDIAAYELSPTANIQQVMQPCAVIGHYDIYLSPTDCVSDEVKGWQLNVQPSNTDSEDQSIDRIVNNLVTYLSQLDEELSYTSIDTKQSLKLSPLILTAQWQKSDYQQAFAQTQIYLRQGDCYQINLTQAWRSSFKNDICNDGQAINNLIEYLPALHRNTGAPFAGYLADNPLNKSTANINDWVNESSDSKNNIGFELLSCSPELFFTFIKEVKTNNHHIVTKPIKGTIPRGNNIEQDAALKQKLIDSDKDRAENVMIVDLLRNDLGKYAKTGSVKVPQLFEIESFSNVHHMVSTITAELKEDTHSLAVLFGSLPAGSITGTPKKRAVEIISELEMAPRGAYCGTMGYMNFDGSGQWNVLIRTLQANKSLSGAREVSLWAGGGITIASDCIAEYQECLDKVGNLLAVLAQAN